MGLLGKLKEVASSVGLDTTTIPGIGKLQNPHQNAAPMSSGTVPTQQPVVNATPVAPQPSASAGFYNDKLERLIDMALADGELTEKEKQVLYKKAEEMGIDLDEFEMVLDSKLYERQQQMAVQSALVSATGSAPKSDKFGDIKKCPACGTILQSFSTRCPDCGYEFKNIEANCSIQRLFEMLNDVENNSRDDSTSLIGGVSSAFAEAFGGTKDTRKKKAIIQNFPIPTTKDDILEFLSLAVPLAKKPKFFDSDTEKAEMVPVWKSKCEQIVIKARLSMKEDKETLNEIMEIVKEIGIK